MVLLNEQNLLEKLSKFLGTSYEPVFDKNEPVFDKMRQNATK